nr:putative mfs-type transporter pb1e7.08c [Quercus suber]
MSVLPEGLHRRVLSAQWSSNSDDKNTNKHVIWIEYQGQEAPRADLRYVYEDVVPVPRSSQWVWSDGRIIHRQPLNIYYGTLYAYTPEVLPSAHRGTGNGISIGCNRIMGIVSAAVASSADTSTAAPIYTELIGWDDALFGAQGNTGSDATFRNGDSPGHVAFGQDLLPWVCTYACLSTSIGTTSCESIHWPSLEILAALFPRTRCHVAKGEENEGSYKKAKSLFIRVHDDSGCPRRPARRHMDPNACVGYRSMRKAEYPNVDCGRRERMVVFDVDMEQEETVLYIWIHDFSGSPCFHNICTALHDMASCNLRLHVSRNDEYHFISCQLASFFVV